MAYESSVVVPLPPDETFAMITEPERLRRWNNVSARVDLRAGGDYRWNIIPGHYTVGFIREVEPGRRLVMGWGDDLPESGEPDPTTVTITLEPTDEGTLVRLVHSGLSAEAEPRHAAGWDHYLARLVVAGAGGDAGPDNWWDHIDYLDGLDELKSAEATYAIASSVLRRIGPDDLANATPCTEYTVAQVAEHLSRSIVGIGRAGGAELPPPSTNGPGTTTAAAATSLEADVGLLAQPALEAWAARGLDGTIDIGAGAMPAADVLGILSVEFLVHAWDLARGTDQTLTIDDDLASYVLTLSQRVVDAELREQVGFNPAITPAPDATGLEQLLNFTGRASFVPA
jgi:uncharacterized protein (TIGR03086 family)